MSQVTDISTSAAGSQTVHRAFELLRLVACGQEGGVRLKDLVEITGLNKPTVHRLLRTLIQESAIEQDHTTRRYRIGRDLSLLGIARNRRFPLQVAAESYLSDLAERVGDTVFLSVRDRLDSVCIMRCTGNEPIQVLSIEVGVRRPLGRGVSGVILLACLSKKEANTLIEQNKTRLIKLGDRTEDIMQQVENARELGYAFRPSGLMPMTSAISVPLMSEQGSVLGAITITAMQSRLPSARLPEVIAHMQERARRIVSRHQDIVQRG